MLNQVNLMANNNKFYVIQLLEQGGQLLLFTRYGRVGEVGKPESKAGTVKDFCSKYRSKTKVTAAILVVARLGSPRHASYRSSSTRCFCAGVRRTHGLDRAIPTSRRSRRRTT